eukprot:CAMPEP_0195523612 /NCGR_PEP_ID=MMETSP0794_2-20130614/22879_1 /TAXON_ID=515487 /ORGANISM="Stephanopyxis turris, Strain CCMP 815" /LENGTH=623 /DNA_ID=CAMNT_0040653639 /DNA_START=82 /DNA_END=1953 /DNA_ORIENTATION=+
MPDVDSQGSMRSIRNNDDSNKLYRRISCCSSRQKRNDENSCAPLPRIDRVVIFACLCTLFPNLGNAFHVQHGGGPLLGTQSRRESCLLLPVSSSPRWSSRNKPFSSSSIVVRRRGSMSTRLFLVHDLHVRPVFDEDYINEHDNNKVDSDTEINDEQKSGWLTWMSSGRKDKKGYDEYKMRESVKLGGVPRSERYSSRDWLHNAVSLPTSNILRDIRYPVLATSGFGVAISVIHRVLMRRGHLKLAKNMCIPSQPHAMLVSSLGLLLVFRTNSAYQRFVEGRKIWENILSEARDLSRMMKLYETQIGVEKRRRLQRLLAAFPYLLRHRIRPNLILRKLRDPTYVRDPEFSLLLYDDKAQNDNDEVAADLASEEEGTGRSRREPRELFWVDKRTLPWRLLPSDAMEGCARAQNRPLWVCDRMAKELVTVPDQFNFSPRERLALLTKLDKISHSIGQCERIHQTLVPLNYARHSLRSLTVWLLSLPFALVKDTGLMTGPVIAVMSWLLFGVYEIGYTIEDPFQGTLRLSILCDAIRRDVLGDELHRETAFKLQHEQEEDDEDADDHHENPSTEEQNNDEQIEQPLAITTADEVLKHSTSINNAAPGSKKSGVDVTALKGNNTTHFE